MHIIAVIATLKKQLHIINKSVSPMLIIQIFMI